MTTGMKETSLAQLAATGVESRISDDLAGLLEKMSINQIRYCVARQRLPDHTAAGAAVGLARSTIYGWPDYVEEAVRLIATDGVTVALHLRARMLAEAVAVKVAGLQDDDVRVRQAVATELIDWELGKAVQRADLRVSAVQFTIRPPEDG